MLEYNEVKEGRFIVLDGTPYEVLGSHVFRKQQRKPVNATKLKNLITGKVTEYSFAVSDRVVEAELTEKIVEYLYTHRGEYWFTDPRDKSQRFKLGLEELQGKENYLKPNSSLTLLYFQDKLLGLKLPIKLALKVKTAPPAVKGNTVQGGAKKAVLETGLEVNVPLFINEGDEVIINTTTGDYVERASKE